MSITVYPYKLTARELEARLAGGVTVLPGQLLRFEGEKPAYGEIIGVKTLSSALEGKEGVMLRVHLLYGQPNLSPQSVTILTDAEMAQEVQRMQEPFEHPLHFGDVFTGEFFKLGPLTLVDGDDFVLKYDAMMMLIAAITPYQRMLIVDPLGIFSDDAQMRYFRAGEDIRLSVQAVGSKRFLTAFGELFPESLRDIALEAIADLLPVNPHFIGFQGFLNLDVTADLPLRNLILQNYQAVAQARVFAELPDQVFGLESGLAKPINVVDLSGLSEPWKSLFYEEVCHELFRNAGGDIVPVLIYPENYLNATDLQAWIQKADEAEMHLLVLASPYGVETLQPLANNMLLAESQEQICLEGDLTLGLPVRFPLPDAPVMPRAHETAVATASMSIPSPLPSPTPATLTPPPVSQSIVDLSAPEPEAVLPVSSDRGMYAPTPTQTESRMPSPDEPESLQFAAPPVDVPIFQSRPPEVQAGENFEEELVAGETLPEYLVFPGPEETAGSDEFSFDVNLDQKPEAEWNLRDAITESLESAAMPSVISNSLSEFEELTLPEADVGLYEPASDEAGYEAGYEIVPEQDEFAFEASPDMPEEGAASETGSDSLSEIQVPYFQTDAPTFQEDEVAYVQKEEPVAVQSAGYKAGDRIRHEKYGVGVIDKVLPMDDNVILNITFDGVGKRLLDPKLCNLTKEPAS